MILRMDQIAVQWKTIQTICDEKSEWVHDNPGIIIKLINRNSPPCLKNTLLCPKNQLPCLKNPLPCPKNPLPRLKTHASTPSALLWYETPCICDFILKT